MNYLLLYSMSPLTDCNLSAFNYPLNTSRRDVRAKIVYLKTIAIVKARFFPAGMVQTGRITVIQC